MAEIDPRLLEILVCPTCKGPVVLEVNSSLNYEELTCSPCSVAYPIRGGIPVMLTTEARPFSK